MRPAPSTPAIPDTESLCMIRKVVAAHLIAVIARLEHGPRRQVRHAARGAVDAHGPVCVVAALDVQHSQQLVVPRAVLGVPGHWVAAAVDRVAQDVQPCIACGGAPHHFPL